MNQRMILFIYMFIKIKNLVTRFEWLESENNDCVFVKQKAKVFNL